MNNATNYGVNIEQINVNGTFWRVQSIDHLPSDENRGRHHVYVNVVDESGNRVYDSRLRIGYTWNGRKSEETVNYPSLDKPSNEDMGNVPIFPGQELTIWIAGDGVESEKVVNLHTKHPDEIASDGSVGNGWNHHSFRVTFAKTSSQIQLEDKYIILGRKYGIDPSVIRLLEWDLNNS